MANLQIPETPPLAFEVIQGAATALDQRQRNKRKQPVYDWQYKAFDYYDTVNEVHYAANYVGNAMRRIRLIAAEIPKEDNEAPKETTNVDIKKAVSNFKNSRSGQSGLLGRFGMNIFLAGELFISGQVINGRQEWEVYSPLELRINTETGVSDSKYSVQNQTGETWEDLPKNAFVTRIWKEHPRKSFDPDSAMRVIGRQCEKLILLDKQDIAIAKSKYANSGILVLPSEILPTATDSDGNLIEDASQHPFIIGLQDTMVESILGDENPEDVVPSIITGQADYLKEIRHITFDKSENTISDKQKDATIRRMATAMDLPNEVLMGLADVNHWSAWRIQEDTFQTHLRPFVELICSSLTSAYLHPQLKKQGVKDYEKYVIWYDDSNLVARPDKSTNALKGLEALVLSEEAVRREIGFTEDDAPSEEEFNRRAGLAFRNPYLLDGTLETYQGQNNKHDASSPYQRLSQERPPKGTHGPSQSAMPGTEQGKKEITRKTDIQASAYSPFKEKVEGYLEASIDRALEKAGARVRTIVPKKSELGALIAQTANEDVFTLLDSQQAEKYNVDLDNLLDFSQAIQYVHQFLPNLDADKLSNFLKNETLRKINNQNSNFSINLDNLDN